MNFLRIMASFVSVAGMGLAFGVGLAIAARILEVRKDRRLADVEAVLPGLNCGACGYAGCPAYAAVLAREEETRLDLCLPGGAEVAAKLASLMGTEMTYTREKTVTQVHCRGGRETAKVKFEYKGVQDCNALYALYGGDKVCTFSCLGLGSCIRVCPVDAIDYDLKGLVWVDKDKCISCGKCVDICPTRVMQWVPYKADLIVACSSTDDLRTTKSYCSVGCIGCKICAKKSPEGGYQVENFLSRIDYKAVGDRKAGAEACPPKCIVPNVNNV